MISDADRVMSLCVATGTHLGSWLGIPPTGKSIRIQMVVIHRIRAGQIAEDWVMVDTLGVFQQLGVVRPTEELLVEFSAGIIKATD